jgi:dipeptidyl-peptidase-4
MNCRTAWAVETDGARVQQDNLTIERIYQTPSLTGEKARLMKLSPDGKRLAYLKEHETDKDRYDLWLFDVTTGKHARLVNSARLARGEHLSDEEKARRERMRLYAKGITDFSWSDDGRTLLVPVAGDIFVLDVSSGKLRALVRTPVFETDVRLSPGGHWASFVREQNLWLVDTSSGEQKPLTTDGKGPVKYGMAEFVAQEEMDRLTGYWWSPDERWLAVARVDESSVALQERYEVYPDGVKVIRQRYPKTGTSNAKVELWLLSPRGENPVQLDLGPDKDVYLARAHWSKDGRYVYVEQESRDQKRLRLWRFAVSSGKRELMLEETSETWLNLHQNFRALNDGGFLWSSERDGHSHLYRYDASGRLVAQLTRGPWEVLSVAGIEEDEGKVFFLGNRDNPLETHLFAASLEPGDAARVERLTHEPGVHSASMARHGRLWIDTYSSVDTPPRVLLKDTSGKLVAVLIDNPLNEQHPFWPYLAARPMVQFGKLQAEDGQWLYYRLVRPARIAEGDRLPVIVDVYGGPGVQRVRNVWPDAKGYWHYYMANRGYVIFSLDNRGSANRGVRFESPIYRKLGDVELRDQLRGVAFLKTLGFADPRRIGLFGWSYGGYMTIMGLLKAPEVFSTGVAVAPVTDWRLYDTHYTERYLGMPSNNADGYRLSSVFPYVRGLSGALLLVHGMADDNVLYTHATAFYDALQKANKPFDIMVYPGSKHSLWGSRVRVHLFNTISRYFDQHLKGTPPQ